MILGGKLNWDLCLEDDHRSFKKILSGVQLLTSYLILHTKYKVEVLSS